MRQHQPYSVFPRRLPSGRRVYYFQTYNDGRRTAPRSTGQTTKTAALAYIALLLKQGRLVAPADPLFQDWAADWWVWDRCPYVRSHVARGDRMTRMHASIRRWLLQKHILPALRAKRLSAIKPTDIEALLLGKLEEGLSAQSVNHLRATLSTMFKQAMRQGLRDDNPVAIVPKAKGSQAERGILTREEVDRLLSEEDIETVWQGDMVAYTANLLAATAGLRLGEVLALRAQDVQADHLIVAHSWNALQGLKGTKTGRTRVVPIPEKTRDYLARLCAPTRAFLFGEPWPVEGDKIRQALYRALGRIGITDQERRRRHLCFHSWRHWYNTMLRGQVSDAKLRLLTGHQTQAMCDNYTHYGAEDFGDVRQALATLWGDQKQEGQP